MKQTSAVIAFSFLVLIGALMSNVRAKAASPEDTLNQYVTDLQKNPNDYVLREKIIKHLQTMTPAPAIPEEARRYFIEGNALLKAAKEQGGYGLAIEAFRQCLLIAPWWAEAYNNYAVALDVANQFDDAVAALKLYIATSPGEGEARKAQDKIYEIGAKKKLAAMAREAPTPQAAPAPPPSPFEALLKKIDGRRYTCPADEVKLAIDVRGKVFVLGYIFLPGSIGAQHQGAGYHEAEGPSARFEIRGRISTYPLARTNVSVPAWGVESTFTISEDGESISMRTRFNDGDLRELIYLWQR